MRGNNSSEIKDCLIIGAGPAGLTAGIYLQRFRRNIMVIDNDQSRASLIPRTHNYPGFIEGISGQELLSNLRQQFKRYGGEVYSGNVLSIQKNEKDLFTAIADKYQLSAKTIILATGVVDIEPKLPDVKNAIQQGLVRHCPICDGYEVINQKIGVIGSGEKGLREALFLRTYSTDITLLTLGDEKEFIKDDLHQIQAANIQIVTEPISEVKIIENSIAYLQTKSGRQFEFDAIYSALGAVIRSDMAIKLGAKHIENYCLEVDQCQQTSIPGLYAAGDIVVGLNQICVATGQGAIAATAIHNAL